jgi:hypothetical protein
MVRKREFSHERLPSALGRSGRVLLLASLLLAGCGSETPTDTSGNSGRAFTVKAGQEFEIRLQSIGPGEYRSPPSVSSNAVRFREVRLATPHVPAGVTQLFRFEAIAPGRAIVIFRHSEQSPTVIDTVDVQ